MRIIDEKGRLFGKINIIDFLVIVFLFCLTPMFYFGYKIISKRHEVKVETPQKEYLEVETDCLIIKLTPELLKVISVGDKEIDENGQIIGEIISLGEVKPYKYEFDLGTKEKVVKESVNLKQVKAKLKFKAEIKENEPYYKEKKIKVGLPLEFKADRYLQSLTVVPFEEEAAVIERTIDLYVVLKDLDEEVAKLVSVGDKQVDKKGQTIAEILKTGQIEACSLMLDLGGGNYITGEDKNKRQISVLMRLKCQIKDGKLYFKGKKTELNSPFIFETEKYKSTVLPSESYYRENLLSLKVMFEGLTPELANIIQKGDIAKGLSGEVQAEIKEIISSKKSEILTLTLKGDDLITVGGHPFKRDILMWLDVYCIEKDGQYYYRNMPMKVGNTIVFSTDLYTVTGTIIGMEMPK